MDKIGMFANYVGLSYSRDVAIPCRRLGDLWQTVQKLSVRVLGVYQEKRQGKDII